MRKIKLVPDKPFYNSCDITVFDVTGEKEKKRCKITAEYAKVDVEQLKRQNMDYQAAMEYYREWIYKVVKHYIADDWECAEGMDEVIEIIRERVEPYFQGSDEA